MTASPTTIPERVPFTVAARSFHLAWIARGPDEGESADEALKLRAYHAGQALAHGASDRQVATELHRFIGTYDLKHAADTHIGDLRIDAAQAAREMRGEVAA